jgi:GT2 family glycosyltransferase
MALGSQGTRDPEAGATPRGGDLPSGRPDVRVVILSWRDPESVARGLAALARQEGVSFEVEVVDNDSPPRDVAALEVAVNGFAGGRARLVQTGENLGYAGGMNSALRRWLQAPEGGAPRYALLLTQDMEFPEADALARLAGALDHAGHLGAVGPVVRTRTPPHAILSAGGTLDPARLRVGQRTTLPTSPSGADEGVSLPVPWLDGCALMLRRRAMEEVGLFDDRFFLYFEDLDLGVRLNQAGWPPAVHHRVVAHHERPRLWGAHYPYYMARNRFLFWSLRFQVGGGRVFVALIRDVVRYSGWALVQVLRGEARVSRWERLRSVGLELRGAASGFHDALTGRYGPRDKGASVSKS